MLKVTTPVSRSTSVRSVYPLNIPESDETSQERCQTRATEVEHNLACARSEYGANHTTTKSPTGRVNPSYLATLNSIPGICGDQNLDNDIIGALFDDNDRTMSILSGSGKGKSLPTVAKAPSHLRKRGTSKDYLNPRGQPVPKMLKVTTPVSRSTSVRSVYPLNIPESDETSQERCQTRATEVEHNLACARSEYGANHTTTKSPTGRVNPSSFPPLPDLATLNSIPGICGDQNLDNDIIGALFDDNDRTMSILSGSGKGKSLPTVAKAPSHLRKRGTSKDYLNPRGQPVPKMLKVTTPVSRSTSVRSVYPLNIPESDEVSLSSESDHALLSSCISKGIFKK
ncbi:unnamed protein product [Ilex paraguariensis]|uniref:Uncharacterized protein n=1 Tax=Ilex paraguariensis TaxID=185542 RepID=A0ABC8SAG8_9AQUA